MKIVVVVVLIVAAVVAAFLLCRPGKKDKFALPPGFAEPQPKGGPVHTHVFSNHLQVPVNVNIPDFNTPGAESWVKIAAQGSESFTGEFDRFRVFLEDGRLFSNYQLEHPLRTREVHLGQVTSRIVEPSYESSRLVSTGQETAPGGMPWVVIHNVTEVPLLLSNLVEVPPHDTYRYLGRHHRGVALGTIFEDDRGVFPTFISKVPCTDIYYGVTSDLEQAPYGGVVQGTFDDQQTGIMPDFVLQLGQLA